jgi:hypothetical protein
MGDIDKPEPFAVRADYSVDKRGELVIATFVDNVVYIQKENHEGYMILEVATLEKILKRLRDYQEGV